MGSSSLLAVPVRAVVLWLGMFVGGVGAVLVAGLLSTWEPVPLVGSAASWATLLGWGIVIPLAFVRSAVDGALRTATLLGVVFASTLVLFGWDGQADVSFGLASWWLAGPAAGLLALLRDQSRPPRSEQDGGPRSDAARALVFVAALLVAFWLTASWLQDSWRREHEISLVTSKVEFELVQQTFGRTAVTPALALEAARRIGLDDRTAIGSGDGAEQEVVVRGVRAGVCVTVVIPRAGGSGGASGVRAIDGRRP